MIAGVGVDLVTIARMKSAIRRKKFIDITFTPKEVACYRRSGCQVVGLASRFAGKEAVFKAVGTGWIDGTEVEILPDKMGKPVVKLYRQTLKLCRKAGIKKIHVSLSSFQDYAVGLAVAEK